VDAIPDLSDTQVIIKTSYPGQAPQVIETGHLSAVHYAACGAGRGDGARLLDVRRFFHLCAVQGRHDLYWARARVLEYLNQAAGKLPPGVTPTLGPDATGVGWIFEYALVDRSGKHDLAQLRSLQDWFLKLELQGLPASPKSPRSAGWSRNIRSRSIRQAARLWHHATAGGDGDQRSNGETGGSVIEMSGAEYMIRARGYIHSLDDLRLVPLGASATGAPVQLGDVASVQLGRNCAAVSRN